MQRTKYAYEFKSESDKIGIERNDVLPVTTRALHDGLLVFAPEEFKAWQS